ncbi:uncharacterized protein Dvar_36000 [Desulfosarcina variabilis str. Montpellier]|uniref:YcxB family protein n=1 Tax=Desulfosarcina variabilis TaxID=2300 RepID=UPI003AFA19F9
MACALIRGRHQVVGADWHVLHASLKGLQQACASRSTRAVRCNKMIKLKFKLDDQFLVDGFKRYRRQHAIRNSWFVLKIILSCVFLILAFVSIYHGDYKLLFFFAVVVILMLYGHKIDYLFIKRRSRKSPHINEDVEIILSENGFQAVSSKSETKAKWSIFTEAVAFRDGFLLFQGPRLFNWLPFNKISEGNIQKLIDLIKANIEIYKIIEQPASQGFGPKSGPHP